MWAIDDISPNDDNASLSIDRVGQSLSGKALCVAISADGTRAYVGGHSGVWRSDDGGDTWWHPEWPQPPLGVTDVPGALVVPNVHDLLISPADNDVVLAATAYDAREPDQSGIYRSTDGAQSWSLVHQFTSVVSGSSSVSMASQLAQAPDDPNLVYAAGGFAIAVSADGGVTWAKRRPPFDQGEDVWHVPVGPALGSSRRVYAVGRSPSNRAYGIPKTAARVGRATL